MAVYLDNNGTTRMAAPTLREMLLWANKGNPSAEYASARDARTMLDSFRDEILADCGVARGEYTVIFTSGGSEANSHALTAVACASARGGKRPRFVTSVTEHKSVLETCRTLEENKQAEIAYLPVARDGKYFGTVTPAALAKALQTETALVSIMAANNETGALSAIATLGAIAHASGALFHTDAVQAFGKMKIPLRELRIDLLSVSWHKIHGPPGVGALIVSRRALARGFGALVCGAQNGGLRGGTENLPGLAGARIAFAAAVRDRAKRAQHVAKLRERVVDSVSRALNAAPLAKARGGWPRPDVIWITPLEHYRSMPGTLLLAAPGLCGHKVRAALELQRVIVGVGAACSAQAGGPSATVTALGLPDDVGAGVIRASFAHDNTEADADALAAALVKLVRATKNNLAPASKHQRP